MSLFKSREWWSVNLVENEMYDSQSLLILTLGKDLNQNILLGNHDGFLRLYLPSSEIIDGRVLGYKPSDLLLEVQLSSPILQIDAGILVSGSNEKYLAVLHPRLFSVYGLKKRESKETNVGDQMLIELAYQHVLRHSAHSFVLGTFGGVRGRNFICIQSLDGLLSFFEQESFAFQLYLPTFMLPFAFTYLEKIDSFLFLNGSLTLDCFSYEALASSGNSNDKKITKTWEFNLGEGILDVRTLKKGSIVIILSERNFYGLNENGKIIYTKRLEFKPVAICSYICEESKNLMNIIVTDSHFLNLYEEVNLKWSMKIDQIPVSVNRIFLHNLPGGIVLLSEDGYLQVVYIGTHPSLYIVPPLIQPEIEYQKAEEELKQLQKKIADNDIVDPLTADLVSVVLKVDKTFKVENDVRKCNVIVEIHPQCPVCKLQVLFLVEPPLTAINQNSTLSNCSEKTFVESSVYLERPGVVSNLTLQVIVTYLVNEGMARCVQKSATLPLGLVVVETAAVKEAEHKITISTNKPICGMNQLFRDFTTEESFHNAIGFKFFNSEHVVTILAAKSSQRYRLQSDVPAAVSLLLNALIERLKYHFRKDSDFSLNYTTFLPIDVFIQKIDIHHDHIKNKKKLEEKLSKETFQYRTVQKKVLTNLKDVTPKSVSNLNRILKDTHKMILTSINKLEEIEEELFLSRCTIRSFCRIIIELLKLTAITDDDLKLLKRVFNPNIHDTENQGWLEVQEAAASFILRTALAKSEKDQLRPTEIDLKPITDTTKIAKHFSTVIDRVTKGTHLLERSEFESKKRPLPVIQGGQETDETLFDEEIPKAYNYVDFESRKKEKGNEKKNLEKAEPKKPSTDSEKNEKIDEGTEKDDDADVETKKAEPEIPSRPKEKQPLEEHTKNVEEPKTITEELEKENQEVKDNKKADVDDGGNDDDDDDDAIWDINVEEMKI